MTRRSFLASLGIAAIPAFLVRPASARVFYRSFAGGMDVAGNATPLSLDLTSSSGRNRMVTGTLWVHGDVDESHGISGRFSRDRKKLTFAAGLPNNQELRFEGKFTRGGTAIEGRVMLSANGSPVAGGTFSFEQTA